MQDKKISGVILFRFIQNDEKISKTRLKLEKETIIFSSQCKSIGLRNENFLSFFLARVKAEWLKCKYLQVNWLTGKFQFKLKKHSKNAIMFDSILEFCQLFYNR